MTKLTRALMAGTMIAGLAGAASAQEGEPLKIGFMTTLEGTYTVLGEEGQRGFQIALNDFENAAGGRPLEVIVAPTDASPESALRAVRKLVEQDEVDMIVGPLSGSEGIAVRDYCKSHPDVTFVDGTSGAQETTFVDPCPNYFRFNTEGAQWGVGLGEYVMEEKGWEFVASVAEDYSFAYTNFLGFALGYCEAGGKIVERQWVPLGTKDFGSIIAALPDDVDAIYVGLGGADAVNFLNQYQQAGGDANLIGGSIMVDGTVLSAKGDAKNALIGTPSSGPQADDYDSPAWAAWVEKYQSSFPEDERFPTPALMSTNYYNASTAAFSCLDEVGGDLTDGHEAFRGCLASTVLEAPNGTIALDENRQAIGSTFIVEVVENDDGSLGTQMVRKVDEVNQTLGMDEAEFRALGAPSRDIVENCEG